VKSPRKQGARLAAAAAAAVGFACVAAILPQTMASAGGPAGTLIAEFQPPDAHSGSFYGDSVSIYGSTAVVGSPFHTVGPTEGVVYTYTKGLSGWKLQSEFNPTDGGPGDDFGRSVSLYGSTLVVGAPGHSTPNATTEGTVYVFTYSGTRWNKVAELEPSDGQSAEGFGFATAIYGNTLVASTATRAIAGQQENAAYVFTKSGSTWVQKSELVAPNGAVGDDFGQSLSISEGNLAVGAPERTAPTPFGSALIGAVDNYTATFGGWKLASELKGTGGLFGWSVALNGSTLAVGAPGLGENEGEAFVYVKGTSGWANQASLVPPATSTGDEFGVVISLSGSVLVAGAPGTTVKGSAQGAAFLYVRNGTTWPQTATLTASDGASGDAFGGAVSDYGTTAIVGDYFHTANNLVQEGAAYLYQS
jgi:hypothetical protein